MHAVLLVDAVVGGLSRHHADSNRRIDPMYNENKKREFDIVSGRRPLLSVGALGGRSAR